MASPSLERTPSRGSGGNRSTVNMSQFEVKNKYHSQGLAAGGSALLDAVNRGKVHLAKFILDAAGEDDVVNTRDFKGKTPLIRACYIREEKTRDKTIELLLEKGADVNIQDDIQRTVLSYACELRCNDVVRMLVKNNVDPDMSDKEGNTPLIHSALVGNDVAIEILIKSFRRLGLQVDHVNNEGLTALLIAAKNGFIECASILALDGKACISFRDREQGLNAEEWARVQGCTTPEVLPFSTQAYRYARFSDSCSPTRNDNGTACSASPSPGRAHLSVGTSSPTKQGRQGRRMSQIPPRMVEQKAAPGKVKRGSLPTIKFTGLFSTKQPTESDGVLKTLQQKTENAVRKQKSNQYCVKDSTERVNSGSKSSSRPRSAGGTPRTQRSPGGSTSSTGEGTKVSPKRRDNVRTPSQSDMQPSISINSKPQTSCSAIDRNNSLDRETSIATLSLVDCSTSRT